MWAKAATCAVLVSSHLAVGVRLVRNDPALAQTSKIVSQHLATTRYKEHTGVAIADLNNDGRNDVIIAAGRHGFDIPVVLMNLGQTDGGIEFADPLELGEIGGYYQVDAFHSPSDGWFVLLAGGSNLTCITVAKVYKVSVTCEHSACQLSSSLAWHDEHATGDRNGMFAKLRDPTFREAVITSCNASSQSRGACHGAYDGDISTRWAVDAEREVILEQHVEFFFDREEFINHMQFRNMLKTFLGGEFRRVRLTFSDGSSMILGSDLSQLGTVWYYFDGVRTSSVRLDFLSRYPGGGPWAGISEVSFGESFGAAATPVGGVSSTEQLPSIILVGRGVTIVNPDGQGGWQGSARAYVDALQNRFAGLAAGHMGGRGVVAAGSRSERDGLESTNPNAIITCDPQVSSCIVAQEWGGELLDGWPLEGSGLAMGDLDGDGHDDVVEATTSRDAGRATPQRVYWGMEGSRSEVPQTIDSFWGRTVAVGRIFEKKGNLLDVVLGTADGMLKLYRNMGNRTFSLAHTLQASADGGSVRSISVAPLAEDSVSIICAIYGTDNMAFHVKIS